MARSSVRELVGSDDAMALVVAYLGPVGTEFGGMRFTEALFLARAIPGVRVKDWVVVGPAGAELLASDTCIGGLSAWKGSSWPALFAALERNSSLRQLRLYAPGLDAGCGVLQQHDVSLLLEALAANAGLEELDLAENELDSTHAQALAGVLARSRSPTARSRSPTARSPTATLRVLGLRSTGLGDVGALILSPSLQCAELDLSLCRIKNFGGRALAAALESNGTVRKLALHGNPLSDAAGAAIARALVSNVALRELDLSNTGLGRASGAALADTVRANRTLQVLDLSSSGIALFALAPNNNNDDDDDDDDDDEDGDTLDAGFEGDGDDDCTEIPHFLAALELNVGLRALRLRRCVLGWESCRVLAKALFRQRRCVLQELDLDDTIGIAHGDILASCLRPGAVLRELQLRHTGVGAEACFVLAQGLRGTRTLRTLDLSTNPLCAWKSQLDSNCWPALFAALAHNASLHKLALRNCSLEAGDVVELAAALEANHVLRELDLGGNRLDAQCSKYLGGALARNRGLRVLLLGDNRLDDAQALASAVACNTTLRELDLSFNELDDGTARAFAAALRSARTPALRKLVLSSARASGFGEAARQALAQAALAAGCSVNFRHPNSTTPSYDIV